MLPHIVRYVMLSATVPNALEFALWIAELHSQVRDRHDLAPKPATS